MILPIGSKAMVSIFPIFFRYDLIVTNAECLASFVKNGTLLMEVVNTENIHNFIR